MQLPHSIFSMKVSGVSSSIYFVPLNFVEKSTVEFTFIRSLIENRADQQTRSDWRQTHKLEASILCSDRIITSTPWQEMSLSPIMEQTAGIGPYQSKYLNSETTKRPWYFYCRHKKPWRLTMTDTFRGSSSISE